MNVMFDTKSSLLAQYLNLDYQARNYVPIYSSEGKTNAPGKLNRQKPSTPSCISMKDSFMH
jgi:hypothetical protein